VFVCREPRGYTTRGRWFFGFLPKEVGHQRSALPGSPKIETPEAQPVLSALFTTYASARSVAIWR
jgi:hypothetical protein